MRPTHIPEPRPLRMSIPSALHQIDEGIVGEVLGDTPEKVITLLVDGSTKGKGRPFCPLWQQGGKKDFHPSHLPEDVWRDCGDLEK